MKNWSEKEIVSIGVLEKVNVTGTMAKPCSS